MTVPAILVLGNVNVDLVLGEVDGWPAIGTEVMVDRCEMRAGGSAGNTALALTGLGVAHLLIAATGDDPNGEWLREQFDETCCEWIVDPGDTTITVGIVHKGGDRAFFTTPGHLQRAKTTDILLRLPEAPNGNACAIISGGFLMPDIMDDTSILLDALHAKGWLTALDPGWPPQGWTEKTRSTMRRWLAKSEFAMLNEDEALGYTGLDGLDEAAERIAQAIGSEHTLVLKLGEKGASVYSRGMHLKMPAPAVQVIDTVGAGDTFNAAFLASISAGGSLETALSSAVQSSARAISTYPRSYDR